MEKIGFIGAGNMAEALIKGIIAAKVYKSKNILISDIQSDRGDKLCAEYKINSAQTNVELAQKSDVLILSVKPPFLIRIRFSVTHDIIHFYKEVVHARSTLHNPPDEVMSPSFLLVPGAYFNTFTA